MKGVEKKLLKMNSILQHPNGGMRVPSVQEAIRIKLIIFSYFFFDKFKIYLVAL